MVTKHYCDLCGKETKGNTSLNLPIEYISIEDLTSSFFNEYDIENDCLIYDLCLSCDHKLSSTLVNFIKENKNGN